ncbi:MAG: septum formation initiator family protein [Candidatus Limivicinus sp.]
MGKRNTELFFNAVAVLFSALLLVMSLLCAVETAEVNDQAAALEKENERLKTENQILQTRLDNSLSLEELETYALEELGMQRPAPGQIRTIEITEHLG